MNATPVCRICRLVWAPTRLTRAESSGVDVSGVDVSGVGVCDGRVSAFGLLELDGYPVVDASEDQGAEGHRCGGGDHEVDHVRQTRQMA